MFSTVVIWNCFLSFIKSKAFSIKTPTEVILMSSIGTPLTMCLDASSSLIYLKSGSFSNYFQEGEGMLNSSSLSSFSSYLYYELDEYRDGSVGENRVWWGAWVP